ncbi:hypothetical protein FGD67_05355 [Colwellia sp. M166]|jgi:hypothetical protein|uniref:hypothetical protein n=1 Tax=Colwellia sp. M166 TaxID=2583805 RepID=UPI00211DE18C|nr:hypothetical protein [Colwellia sp. M166]UUO22673.1 hypothetical protein FGD67_05355 [Colwellia sp. M166]|tara:strand:- start:10407 stop:10628 length:222 start_codon:yes stop_codon:yes gene_type:complete
MKTESVTVELDCLEAWLENFISSYNQSGNKQLLAKICAAINAIIQHDDFEKVADSHCSYLKMQNYWLWRYQIA